MLSKINRLRNDKEIKRVLAGGKGYRDGFLFLKSAKNNLEAARFAFIVSKKTAKKAVLRNKIKRRLTEAVRKKIPELKTGFDAVVIAQKGIENKTFQETKENIERLLRNI